MVGSFLEELDFDHAKKGPRGSGPRPQDFMQNDPTQSRNERAIPNLTQMRKSAKLGPLRGHPIIRKTLNHNGSENKESETALKDLAD